MSASKIAIAPGGARRSGRWWRCRCPVHGSHGATLALRDGERGLLVKCFAGCDARDVLTDLRCCGLLGNAPHRCHRQTRAIVSRDNRNDAVHRIALARRIWNAARDARGSPVVRYFAGRSITITLPSALRWAPSLRCLDGGRSPGIVARVEDVNGQLVGVHRTWLVYDATGIWRRRGRATLGLIGGGAVRLAPTAETLLVGEGIETCLAAMQATAIPAWAALSTSGMVGLVLPAEVRQVIILADHDHSGAGERAAHAAAALWLAEGRKVKLALPPEPGSDFNDVLLSRAHAQITELRDVTA